MVTTVSYLLQGLLFSVISTTVLVFFLEKIDTFFTIYKEIIPRLLFFHACMSFIMGTTVLDSMTVRYDAKYGIIIGPLGTLLAGILILFLMAFLTVATNEYLFMVPVSLYVAYAFAQARAINHMYSLGWNLLVGFIIFAAITALTLNIESIDETLDSLFQYYDITSKTASQLQQTYLVSQGSFFHHTEVSITLFSLISLGLLFSPPKLDVSTASTKTY